MPFSFWKSRTLDFQTRQILPPNPTRIHVCSSLSGLVLKWALTALEEHTGLNHKRGKQTTRGKDGACQSRSKICKHQHLEDYLHNLNRERKNKRKNNSTSLKIWTSKVNQMFDTVEVSIFLQPVQNLHEFLI